MVAQKVVVESVSAHEMTLHEAAEMLDVHYMTAYRYVRLGLLPAHKAAGTWRVLLSDLRQFQGQNPQPIDVEDSRKKNVLWWERLEARLLAGDGSGAWAVVEAALVAGVSVEDIYTKVLSPAMVSIGDQWARGDLEIYYEHQASAIVGRIMGRLGPRFVGRGRTKGSIVVGAPQGERHGLVVSMVADLLRQRGWEVFDLGADLPAQSFIAAVKNTPDVVAACVSVTSPSARDAACELIAALREASGDAVPIYVGGAAVLSAPDAEELGAHGWASNVDVLVGLLEQG
ncbi:MAG: helix-turn-helix domain-containing protein [Actinobacteria bacterium]|nr:helix-turn-helix domain-containing protein [Actinomycetota bacterium]